MRGAITLGNLPLLRRRAEAYAGMESEGSVYRVIEKGVSSILDARKDAIIRWIEERLTQDIRMIIQQDEEVEEWAEQIRRLSESFYSSVKESIGELWKGRGTQLGAVVMLRPVKVEEGRVTLERETLLNIAYLDAQKQISLSKESEGRDGVRSWVEGILRGGKWMTYFVLSAICGLTRKVIINAINKMVDAQKKRTLLDELRREISVPILQNEVYQSFYLLELSASPDHIDGVPVAGEKVFPSTILLQTHPPASRFYLSLVSEADTVDLSQATSLFVPIYSPFPQSKIDEIVDAFMENPQHSVAVDFLDGNWEKLGLGDFLLPTNMWLLDFNTIRSAGGVNLLPVFSVVSIPIMRDKDFVYPQHAEQITEGTTAPGRSGAWAVDLERFWHMVYFILFTFTHLRTESFIRSLLAQRFPDYQLVSKEIKHPHIVTDSEVVSGRSVVPLLGWIPTNNLDLLEEGRTVWNTIASYIQDAQTRNVVLTGALKPYGDILNQNKKVKFLMGGAGIGDWQQITIETSWSAILQGRWANPIAHITTIGQVTILPPKSPQRMEAIVNLQVKLKSKEEQFVDEILAHLPLDVEIIAPKPPQEQESSETFTFDSTETPSAIDGKIESVLKKCYEELLSSMAIEFASSRMGMLEHLIPLQRALGSADIIADLATSAIVKFLDKALTSGRENRADWLQVGGWLGGAESKRVVARVVGHTVEVEQQSGLTITLEWEVGVGNREGEVSRANVLPYNLKGILTNIKVTLSLSSPSSLLVDIVGQNKVVGQEGGTSREISLRSYVPYPSSPNEVGATRTQIWGALLFKFVGENGELVLSEARRLLSRNGENVKRRSK